VLKREENGFIFACRSVPIDQEADYRATLSNGPAEGGHPDAAAFNDVHCNNSSPPDRAML
jgi:hypothetical protein